MSRTTDRRQFLKQSAVAGAGFWIAGSGARAFGDSPNEKLNVAVIGVHARGAANLSGVAGQNIVALCDIDSKNLGEAGEKFPKAQLYADFRKMLDAEHKRIDAVVVSTPDHTHAHPSVAAMQLGKHLYCEKPLAHDVHECRVMRDLAKKQKLVTQMGTQIHAGDNYRRVVELVQSGAIGPVREVHVWCSRSWSGGDRPKETPPVPKNIDWDLWLGGAPYRPYHPTYIPFNWRRWWDFGGGSLADMACHYMDVAHWALKLRYPTTVQADGPPPHPETASLETTVKFEYPAREDLPPVQLTWYDGGRRPKLFETEQLPTWGDGVLFVGKDGMLITNYSQHQLLPSEKFVDFKRPEPFIPASVGHHQEWIDACKSGGPTTCNFDYSGALAETVLLGVVSYRVGQKLEWDAKNLKATNCPDADQYLRREYRKGWDLV